MEKLPTQKTYSSQLDILPIWEQHHNFVNNIENNYDVASWQIADMDIWPILKTSFLLRANSFRILQKIPRSKQLLIKVLERARNNSLVAFFRNSQCPPFPSDIPITDILFCLYAKSFENLQNSMCHSIASPWYEAAKKDGYKISTLLLDGFHPNAQKIKTEQNSPVIAYPVVKWHDADIKNINISAIVNNQDLSLFLHNASEQFSNFIFNKNRALYLIRRVAHSKSFFIRFFKKTQPKAIIIQGSYGVISWGLNAAAHELGINVFDLQHGVQGVGHEAYTFQSGLVAKANTLPSGYLVWNEASKRHLRSWVDKPERVISSAPFKLINSKLNIESKQNSFVGQKKTTQQPLIVYLAYFGEDIQPIIKFAQENLHLAKIIIHLHPLSSDNKNNELNQQPVGLLEILNNADAVITALSSAALEAQEMGLPVLVHHPYGQFLLKSSLSAKRTIYKAMNKESLSELLQLKPIPFKVEDFQKKFDRSFYQFLEITGLTRPE